MELVKECYRLSSPKIPAQSSCFLFGQRDGHSKIGASEPVLKKNASY